MLAPLLFLALAAEGPRLLTQDELERAPVEHLTLAQLRSEELRLDDPPAVAPARSMVFVGAGAAVGGGLFAWLAFSQRGVDASLLGSLSIGMACLGLILGAIGGTLLPVLMVRRSHFVERQEAVRLRLTAIRSGEADEPEGPSSQTVVELRRLEARRAGIGGPIGLMSVSAVIGGLGVVAYSQLGRAPNDFAVGLSIGVLFVGLALEGVGLYQLLSRILERADIDEQIRALVDAPPQLTLPPPAVPTMP